MKIGIMTAMDQEYEMVSKVLKSDSKHEIIPVHCGWGKVNSAVNAYKLISEHRPDCIISTGCAGGVAAGVHLLDVVVASQVAYHDCWYGEPNEYGQVQGFPARFEAAPFLLNAAKSLADSSVDDRQQARLHFGLIASGDRFVSGPEDNGRGTLHEYEGDQRHGRRGKPPRTVRKLLGDGRKRILRDPPGLHCCAVTC